MKEAIAFLEMKPSVEVCSLSTPRLPQQVLAQKHLAPYLEPDSQQQSTDHELPCVALTDRILTSLISSPSNLKQTSNVRQLWNVMKLGVGLGIRGKVWTKPTLSRIS